MPRGLCCLTVFPLLVALALAPLASAQDAVQLNMAQPELALPEPVAGKVRDGYQAALQPRVNGQKRSEIMQVLQEKLVAPRHEQYAQWQQALQDIAAYYSQFDEVHALILELAPLNWQLHMSPGQFETRVSGSRLAAERALVRFDPFSAVQLKFNRACQSKPAFCFASPADVLLHELLHVQAVLGVNAVGVLGGAAYPWQHEHHTLSAERRIYRQMRQVDQRPRPLRTEHTGRTLTVACVTCLQ